ncbi:MAG: hypothetical protein JNL28_04770 [Planctomycetes bacterium]|nr:hypothetical protein [Planctomycetota bacterium]
MPAQAAPLEPALPVVPAQLETRTLVEVASRGLRCSVSRDERWFLVHDGLAAEDASTADRIGEPALYECEQGARIALPAGGPWIAAAFAPKGEALWLAQASGAVREFVLPQFEPRRTLEIGPHAQLHDLLLSDDGRGLAWSDRVQRTAGVVEIESGRATANFTNVAHAHIGSHDVTRIAFADAGEHVLVYLEPAREAGELSVIGHSEPGLVLWSIAAQRSTAVLAAYVVDQTPGYALARGGIVYATRLGASVWEWRVYDTARGTERTLPLKPRGGHFIDLFASPSGRFVAEWDFEERSEGVLCVDLDTPDAAHTLHANRSFLGFGVSERGEQLVAGSKDGTITLIDMAHGTTTASLAGPPRFEARRAVCFRTGTRLWLSGNDETAPRAKPQYSVHLLEVEAAKTR